MATINVHRTEVRGDRLKVYLDIDGKPTTLLVRDDADLDRQVLALTTPAPTVTLGSRRVSAPEVVAPQPRSMDDLDLEAFALLVREYRSIKAQVAAGVGKVDQAALDAKVAEIKAAYKDEYAPMLVGVF